MIWVAVLAGSLGCYVEKLLGFALPHSVFERESVRRVSGLLPVALLAALVAVQTFADGQELVIDARVAGAGRRGGRPRPAGAVPRRRPRRRRDRRRAACRGGGVMTEPRKPIFGFLWPKPDPDAPVDGAYRQVRRVRISPRGPVRLAALVLGSIAVTMVAASLVMAALTTAFTVATVVGGALVATGDRPHPAWVGGGHLRQRRGRDDRDDVAPHLDPLGVGPGDHDAGGPAPFLGLPVRVPSLRSVVTTSDGAIPADARLRLLARPVAAGRGLRHGPPAARALARRALTGPPNGELAPDGSQGSPHRSRGSGVVQLDGAAHRRSCPLAVPGVVVADGQAVPGPPVLRRRLHLLLVLREPLVRGRLLDAPRGRARQVVDGQAALGAQLTARGAGCACRTPARATGPTRRSAGWR